MRKRFFLELKIIFCLLINNNNIAPAVLYYPFIFPSFLINNNNLSPKLQSQANEKGRRREKESGKIKRELNIRRVNRERFLFCVEKKDAKKKRYLLRKNQKKIWWEHHTTFVILESSGLFSTNVLYNLLSIPSS